MMIIDQIKKADTRQITAIVDAALDRYNELFPQWEINIFSVEKGKDKIEHIDRIIKYLQSTKAYLSDTE